MVRYVLTTEEAIRDLLEAHRHTLNHFTPYDAVTRVRDDFEKKLAAILEGVHEKETQHPKR